MITDAIKTAHLLLLIETYQYFMKHFLFLFLLILSFCSCKQISGGVDLSNITIDKTQEDNTEMPEAIEIPISHHFDFPVGKPDA